MFSLSFFAVSLLTFSKMQEVTFRIVDAHTGELVKGVEVIKHVTYPSTTFWGEGAIERSELTAKSDGTFQTTYPIRDKGYTSVTAMCKTHYTNHLTFPKEASNKPYILELLLKPKINPIPLIMKRYHYSDDVILSYKGGEAGRRAFDCLKADWLPPHGKGEQADILFTLEKCTIKSEQCVCLSVTFTNPNDGVMLVKDGYASAMFIREAPQELHLIQALSFLKPLTYDGYVEDFPEKHNYVFRVRTSLTPSGEIASAYYGKLYDAFGWYTSNVPDQLGIMFVYFLNPTPNDRNLEDDGFPINTAIKGRKRRTTK
jgi:hypothetical protein